ncbi:PKD domain-containing protein [Undibacterium seohonense]|uniref:PKD domain-containing protein n=1 Tax=Undibacterium seohonense TaxID=1344950 RepID=A0ABR6XA94_9BURK|nr:YCF48-related protein [Undibacterium seohonense]MBC3809588.1 PKD domain-containing protein [Undibacterium seohonense]
MLNRFFTSRLSMVLAVAAGLLISACGGGNDDKLSPPLAAAVLPEILSISAPPNPDLSEAVAYTHSAATMSGLTFVWNFGDGSNSTEAAPKHRYSKAGDYEVSLIVSNSAGHSKESKIKVSVNNLAGVRGLVCSGANDTGWCWQAPQPSGNYADNFMFANLNTGWRVGGAGDIFKTADAGKTWVRQISGVNASLFEVRNFDDKIVWVLGDKKTLLHTIDGGAHWRALPSPLAVGSQRRLDSSQFLTVLSASNLLLETDSASYYSEDSGLTWDTWQITMQEKTALGIVYGVQGSELLRSIPTGRQPHQVLKLEDEKGIRLSQVRIGLAGENVVLVRGKTPDQLINNVLQVGKAMAWRSDDAGMHWTGFSVNGLPAGSDNSKLYSLDKDGKVWLTLHEGKIYRSEDGGVNWSTRSESRQFNANTSPSADPYFAPFGRVLFDGSRVYVVYNYSGLDQYSDDLGKTWFPMKYPLSDDGNTALLDDIQVVNGLLILNEFYTGGFVSTDKGNSWTKVLTRPHPIQPAYHAATFADTKNGLLVNAVGEIKASQDGGKTWNINNNTLPNSYGDKLLIQFVASGTAFLLWKDGLIYKTQDKGISWSFAGPSPASTNFGFFDEKNGWAHIGIDLWPVAITRDGGKFWDVLISPYRQINSVWLDNTSTVTIASDAGLISQSSDGRAGWQQRYTGINKNLRKVYSFDGKIMWAIGDSATVLRSDDAGLNWKPVLVPGQLNFNDIQFADAKTGWIVGQQGFALATQDGGVTWKQQNTGTNVDLLKVQFVDTKTGWLVGANATLLATGTGGF